MTYSSAYGKKGSGTFLLSILRFVARTKKRFLTVRPPFPPFFPLATRAPIFWLALVPAVVICQTESDELSPAPVHFPWRHQLGWYERRDDGISYAADHKQYRVKA